MPPKVKKVSRAQGTTIRTCLIEISVAFTDLEATENIEDEWKVIKKSYFRAVLQHHPDKGGEAVKFRAIHAAWEVLKDLFEKKSVPSFVSSGETPTSTVHEKKMQEFDASDLPTQSWEYFQEAAQEVDPPYRVEPARSNRSSCSAKNGAKKCSDANIAMGEVRIGRMNKESGTYGYWTHIPCWRVASKIWKGLPDPDVCTDKTQFADALHSMNEILFSGFTDLTADQQGLIVEYVMDKTNWAKQAAPRKRKDEPVSVLEDQFTGTHSADSGSSSTSLISSTGSTALVTQRQLFQIPVPGRDGPANTLSGKSCVMTGTFPEVGGGVGLALGKDKVKKMLESFGAKVTGSVSGKTDFLVVGKAPGASKVGEARTRGKELVALKDMADGLRSGVIGWKEQPPMLIETFSAGFYGNSVLPQLTNQEQMKVSGGIKNPKLALGTARRVKDEDDSEPKRAKKRKPAKEEQSKAKEEQPFAAKKARGRKKATAPVHEPEDEPEPPLLLEASKSGRIRKASIKYE